MAKSSLNIKSRNVVSALLHNSRAYNLSYAIDSPANNETKSYISIREMKELVNNIKADYQKHSYRNRRLPSNSTPIREGILNIEEHHTFEDIEKCAMETAKMLGAKVLMISVHRDEGHIDEETGEKVYNLHAHILYNFYNFDTHKIVHHPDGLMAKVQTKVAEMLNMERGVSKSITKKKHIPHGQYRAVAKDKAKAVKEVKMEMDLTVKQLKAEIEQYRKELIQKNKELEEKKEEKVYTKEDYQALQKLKKQLKKSNLAEIAEEFNALKQELEAKDAQIASYKQENVEKDAQIDTDRQYVTKLIEYVHKRDSKIEKLESDVSQKNEEIETLKSKNMQNLKQISRTVSQLNDSTKLIKALKSNLDAKDEQILALHQKTAKNSNSAHYATKFVKNSDEVIDKALKEAFISDKLKAQVKITTTNNVRGDVAILKNFDDVDIFSDPEISQSSSYKRVVEKAINKTVSAITKKVESFVKALERTYFYITDSKITNEDELNKRLLKSFDVEEQKRIEYERQQEQRQQEQSRDDDNDFYMTL